MSSLAIRLAGLVLAFAQGVLTARLLGSEGYGTVAVAMSLVQIAATVAVCGFGPLAVRELPARLASGVDADLAGFARPALRAVMIHAALLAAAIACIALMTELLPPSYRLVTALAALLVPMLALLQLFRGMAQGLGRTALAQSPGELLRPMLIVVGLSASVVLAIAMDSASYIVLTGIGLLGAVIAGAVPLRRLLLPARAALGRPAAYQRAPYVAALPFLGIALASILNAELTTLLLGWLAGAEQTGLYQPVLRIAGLMTLPAMAAGMHFAPRIAGFWQAGEVDRMRRVTATFTLVTTALTVIGAGAIAAAGPWLLPVFGAEFAAGAGLLWFAAGTAMFTAACGPLGILLAMTGRSGAALIGQMTGLTINLAVGFWLIPRYGMTGAALATAAGVVSWNIMQLVTFRRERGFDPSLIGVLLARR